MKKIRETEDYERKWRGLEKRKIMKKMKKIRETEDYERKWKRLEKRKIMKKGGEDYRKLRGSIGKNEEYERNERE